MSFFFRHTLTSPTFKTGREERRGRRSERYPQKRSGEREEGWGRRRVRKVKRRCRREAWEFETVERLKETVKSASR